MALAAHDRPASPASCVGVQPAGGESRREPRPAEPGRRRHRPGASAGALYAQRHLGAGCCLSLASQACSRLPRWLLRCCCRRQPTLAASPACRAASTPLHTQARFP